MLNKKLESKLKFLAPSIDLKDFNLKNDWSKHYKKLNVSFKDQGLHGEPVWWPFPLIFSKQFLESEIHCRVALKDGLANLLPLLAPKQSLKNKQVIVSEELYQLLPNQWRSNFLFYRYQDKRGQKEKASLKTLVFLDFYEGLDICGSLLKILKRAQSSNEALVLVNNFSHYNPVSASELPNILNALGEVLPKARFINWRDLESFSSMADYNCHILKNSLFTSHSYAEFLILQKAGRLEKKIWPWKDKEILISSHAYTPFVDIQIFSAESDKGHPLEKHMVLKKLENLLRQGERRKLLNFLLAVLEEHLL